MRGLASQLFPKVTESRRLSAHRANFGAATRDGVGFSQRMYVDLIQTPRIEAGVPTRYHLMLLFSGRVGKQNFEKKTIELGFRERIGSFVLNRIFGRQHSEHRRQRI